MSNRGLNVVLRGGTVRKHVQGLVSARKDVSGRWLDEDGDASAETEDRL
jgi:hypothetical protein